jgi:hypothetical protein
LGFAFGFAAASVAFIFVRPNPIAYLFRVAREWEPAVALLGLILAVPALVYAVRQSLESKEALHELKQVANSLSTRYLGDFPKYLSEIPIVVGRATTRLTICCAVPHHGFFTDWRKWEDFRTTFVKLARRPNDQDEKPFVRCLFCTEVRRREFVQEQFSHLVEDEKAWREMKEKRSESIDIEHGGGGLTAEQLNTYSVSQLVNDCVRNADIVLQDLYGRMSKSKQITISYSDFNPPVWMWVAESKYTKEAVFVLGTRARDFNAQGFYTRDNELINGLSNLYEHYLDEARELEVKTKEGGSVLPLTAPPA